MNDIELFKVPEQLEDFSCTVTPEGIAEREALIAIALSIESVPKTAEENDRCAQVGVDIQTQIKRTEEAGLALRRPHNTRADEIMTVQKNYLDPLRPHLKRIGGLAAAFRTEEERKAEAERRARAEEISRLQEQQRIAYEKYLLAADKGDMMGELVADIRQQAIVDATTAAIAKPEPEAVKVPGQSFKSRELGWECTDPVALWKARPDLCTAPTPKGSAIRAVCCPEMPVPGLKLWWQASVNFKSR